ncbi:MAG: anti-sigma factor [Planctomycetes bacterium]|nr:anti-sigma factor [Planctomycetota bacterium]
MSEEMDNLKMEQALVDYLHGRLDEPSRKRMEELLAGDASLREQLEIHRKVGRLLETVKTGAGKDNAEAARPAQAAPAQIEALKGVDFDAQRRQIMAKIGEKLAARKVQPPSDAEEAEYRLGQYLDGELNPYRKAEIEERLGKDEWLKIQKRLYDSLQTQIELFRRPPAGVDYAAQKARIMKAVSELASQKARQAPADRRTARILYLRPLLAIASAAAVLILGVLVWFAVRPNIHKPAKTHVAIAMVVPPRAVSGLAQTAVEISPPSWDEMLAPIPVSAEQPVSAGTVMVSVGPAINYSDSVQVGGVGLPVGF